MSKKILKPKVCIAELCTNRSDSTDKIFISVPAPAEKVRRCDWLTACGLGQNDLSQKSHLYVCENHFKMEVDCLNLTDYKSGRRKKILMNKNVIPHRFLRQEDSHSTAVVVEEAAKTIASVSKQTNGMFSQVAYGFESSLTEEVPQSAGVVADDAVKTKASIAKQTDDFFSQATCDVDSSCEKESALTEAFSWPTIIGTSVDKADKAVATVPICLKNVGVNTDSTFKVDVTVRSRAVQTNAIDFAKHGLLTNVSCSPFGSQWKVSIIEPKISPVKFGNSKRKLNIPSEEEEVTSSPSEKNWAVAKSYEVRLAKNPDSELNTDAGGPLGQRKRKVPERYSPTPASGIPLKKSANNVLQRRLSKTWSNESDDPPYPSVADASEKIPVTASSNKPVPESQVDMFEILSDDSGNKSPVLNSSSHSKAMVPVKQTSMAADCGSSTIKSVVGKTVTSKPSTTLESKLLFTCVRSFPEKKMAPFISSKKAGLVSSPDVASKKRVYPLSNLQIENGSHGLKRTTTLVNASKGNSLKNSKESRKYEDAVVARSVSPIRPFQLAIKENVSYKSPVAVNTMVNKQKSIKYLIKKPETAVTKSFSLPTPELRHKDVLNLNHSVRAKPTDDKISEVTLRKVINIERMMQEFLVNQGPILAFIERTNSVVTERDLFPFPVDDEKNFALFLVLLESPEDVAKLMTGRLSSLGGNNLDDRICNIWAAIITDKWGMSLSWAGRDASKYAVKNTKLFHFIYDLVRSSISYTNVEQSAVEETSKNWIYKAGRRYLRAQATAGKRTRLDDEEDPREGMSSAEIGAIDGYYEKEMDLEDGKQESQIGSDEEQNDSESSQSIGS